MTLLVAGSTNTLRYLPTDGQLATPPSVVVAGTGAPSALSHSVAWDTDAYYLTLTPDEVPVSAIGEEWTFTWTWTTSSGDTLRDVERASIGEAWATALCTLQDVKDRAQFTDHGNDVKIQALIEALPRTLQARYGREFIGQTDARREFEAHSRTVPLGISDLRSASVVSLDGVLLTSDVDYTLGIPDELTGTYTRVRISDALTMTSDFSRRFGYARLAVTGSWGVWGDVSEVPADIKEAACETVLAWLDRPVSDIAAIDSSDPMRRAPQVPNTWDIPAAAHRKFQPYSRTTGVY